MRRRRSIAILLCISIGTLTLVTAADPPGPAPRASEETLHEMERLGAFRCELVLTDAKGKRLAALDGIARESASLQSSPLDGKTGFDISMTTTKQPEGKLAVMIELAERTNARTSSDNVNTWVSSNLSLERTGFVIGESIELALTEWDTGRPAPLSVQFTVSRFRATEN